MQKTPHARAPRFAAGHSSSNVTRAEATLSGATDGSGSDLCEVVSDFEKFITRMSARQLSLDDRDRLQDLLKQLGTLLED